MSAIFITSTPGGGLDYFIESKSKSSEISLFYYIGANGPKFILWISLVIDCIYYSSSLSPSYNSLSVVTHLTISSNSSEIFLFSFALTSKNLVFKLKSTCILNAQLYASSCLTALLYSSSSFLLPTIKYEQLSDPFYPYLSKANISVSATLSNVSLLLISYIITIASGYSGQHALIIIRSRSLWPSESRIFSFMPC